MIAQAAAVQYTQRTTGYQTWSPAVKMFLFRIATLSAGDIWSTCGPSTGWVLYDFKYVGGLGAGFGILIVDEW